LRRKADFERLLRRGTRLRVDGYTFFLERRVAGWPRLGILVSRKHSAAASERNYLKRCIREAFRLEQDKLGPVDVLVRPPERVVASPEMLYRLRKLLSRLEK
jgi:ribonuclease P protein component